MTITLLSQDRRWFPRYEFIDRNVKGTLIYEEN